MFLFEYAQYIFWSLVGAIYLSYFVYLFLQKKGRRLLVVEFENGGEILYEGIIVSKQFGWMYKDKTFRKDGKFVTLKELYSKRRQL